MRAQAEQFIVRREQEFDALQHELHSQTVLARAHAESLKATAERSVHSMRAQLGRAESKVREAPRVWPPCAIAARGRRWVKPLDAVRDLGSWPRRA